MAYEDKIRRVLRGALNYLVNDEEPNRGLAFMSGSTTVSYVRLYLKDTDPSASDTNYPVGCVWLNTVAGTAFMCMDQTTPVWDQFMYTSEVVNLDYTTTALTLDSTYFGKRIVIDSPTTTTITLPVEPNIDSADYGKEIQIYKVGAGTVTIDTEAGGLIEDGSSVSNTTTTQTWANISLFLLNGSKWKFSCAPLGSWSTS